MRNNNVLVFLKFRSYLGRRVLFLAFTAHNLFLALGIAYPGADYLVEKGQLNFFPTNLAFHKNRLFLCNKIFDFVPQKLYF